MGVINIKRIMHRSGGMMRRNVERLEVLVVVLYLRPLNHLKTQTRKEICHAFDGASNGMQRTHQLDSSWQGHIDAFPL